MSVPVAVQQTPLIPRPDPGLILVWGDEACLTVGLLLGLRGATPSSPLLVIDGANALNPYLLSDLARRMGQTPRTLLASVLISRPFTAYQLEAAVADRLEAAVAARRPPGVLLAGLLDLLDDADLAAAEARRIFRRIMATITRLAAQPLFLIATAPAHPPAPGREGLRPSLSQAAAWVFRVAALDSGIEIVGEKPAAGRWRWEPEIPLLAAQRWY